MGIGTGHLAIGSNAHQCSMTHATQSSVDASRAQEGTACQACVSIKNTGRLIQIGPMASISSILAFVSRWVG